MKTSIIKILLLIYTFFILIGCNGINTKSYTSDNNDVKNQYNFSEAIKINYTLEEIIDLSNCVLEVKLNKISEETQIRKYYFDVIKVIRGEKVPNPICVQEPYQDTIVIDSNISYSTQTSHYEEGSRYIVILSKFSSVYEDDDRYNFFGDMLIKLDQNDNVVSFQKNYQDIKNSPYKQKKDFEKFVSKSEKQKPKSNGIPFTKSTQPKDIVEASKYIVKTNIFSIENDESDSNRTIYRCKVTEVLKGKINNGDTEVLIAAFKNTVKVGEDYLFMLNAATDTSIIYALSSKNSVVSLTDTKKVEQIKSLIAKQ